MKIYKDIVKHYENCLAEYGDNHLGVDWPNNEDAAKRYQVMLDIFNFKNDFEIKKILDFGCGTAHLLEFIKKNRLVNIEYTGLDFSKNFIDVCRNKFQDTEFILGDILDNKLSIKEFDYIIMNGVFTEKLNYSFEVMWNYFTELIVRCFFTAKKGIAFNVMSKNVDWERDDLFHVSLDLMSNFICTKLTRNYIIRNDYGLYEYTVYIYKV